jgi:putative alpha-1,2-mannosidase
MKTYILPVLIGASVFCGCSKAAKQPVDYVNPYMGNISHLLVPTYPTVHLPNSMLRVYPERADYTSDLISGLPVAVTSHRGSSAFNISPVSGTKDNPPAVVHYTYDNEKVTPYRYSVYLDEEQIAVDYAPSHQSGIYALAFEKDTTNQLIINTRNGELGQTATGGIVGYQLIDGGPTTIYIYLETEQPIANIEKLSDTHAYVLTFNSKQINLRYGISFIDEVQAKKNLKREINTWRGRNRGCRSR